MNIKFNSIPNHIAIVCDGNGRWASQKGLPRSYGHKKGTEPVENITKICSEIGVKVLTFYVFSTENWSRSKKEVDFLMKLFVEFFKKLRKNASSNIKVKHIGIKTNLSDELIAEIKKTEELTQNNTGMVLNIALNYGSRIEIINSVQDLLSEIKENKIKIEDINDEVLSDHLFTHGLPDVDLIIRTSNEHRLSNFLLWQSAKAEIWITKALWPDFTKEHLFEAINYYNENKISAYTT